MCHGIVSVACDIELLILHLVRILRYTLLVRSSSLSELLVLNPIIASLWIGTELFTVRLDKFEVGVLYADFASLDSNGKSLVF